MDISSILDEHRILREDVPLIPFSGQVGGQMPIFAFQDELLVCLSVFLLFLLICDDMEAFKKL